MNRKPHLAALVVMAGLIPFAASAQTTTTMTGTTTTNTTDTFNSLSPGNQKIAEALFNAQEPTEKGPAPLDLNQIAALKGKTGWGVVFEEMKSQGLIDARNLGQVVSGYEHTLNHSAALGAGNSGSTLIVTTGSGHSVEAGAGHTSAAVGSHGGGNGSHGEETTASNAGAGNASISAASAISAGTNGALHSSGTGGGHVH